MSLWRREHVRLVLFPERTLALHRLTTGTNTGNRHVLGSLDDPEGRQGLAKFLLSPGIRNADIDIIVSNRWVNYTLSDPPGAMLRAAEESALALAKTCAVYGGKAQDWCVSVQSQPPDAGVFSAAMKTSRVEAMRELMNEAGIRKYSLRPLLDAAAGAINKQPDKGWWIVVEPGMWCLLRSEDGAWRHVACQTCTNNWSDHLASHLLRAHAINGDSADTKHAWLQPIGCAATKPPIFPEGWQGQLVLPPGEPMWDWDRI